MRQQMNSFTILEEQNEVVDEFLYNISNRMRQQMNSFTILEEQNEVVDEFPYK